MSNQSNANAADRGPEPVAQSLDSLVSLWNEEHADLTAHTQRLHPWLADARQLETTRLSDLASGLKAFRDRLISHFKQEEELGKQLQEACDWVEMAASHRRFASDHQHLTQRIDWLIEKLSQPEPPFESVGQALDEVGLFVDAFELHEEQEIQCLQWLTARPSDFRKLPR